MFLSPRVELVLLVACGFSAVSPAARAEISAGKPIYPLTARLAFAPETRSVCLVQEGDPRNGDCNIAVGERVHEAYESVLKHMFQPSPPGAAAKLEIQVSVASAQLTTFTEFPRVHLDIRVVINAPASGEIDRLRFYGAAPILGPGQDSITNATRRAAEETAHDFQGAFANSVPVVNWLLGQGLEPVGSTLAWPIRGDWLAFGDLGGGIVAGGGDDSVTGGLLARVGLEGPWLLVQGIFSKWAPSFDTAPVVFGRSDTHASAQLNTTDLGVEAGPVLRLGRFMELRAGVGAHLLWGSAHVNSGGRASPVEDVSFKRVVPTISGALQAAVLPIRNGSRFRAGVEVRRYINTTVGFPELSRTIPIADTYIGAFLGFELPWNSRPARTAGVAR